MFPRQGIYYYRRVVPAEHRKFFGCWEVKFSLHTPDYGEAKRLEKRHDSEFEERLAAAIAIANPHAFAERVNSQILIDRGSVRGALGWTGALADSSLRGEDAQAAINLVRKHLGRLQAHQDELRRLLTEIGEVLPTTPLSADVWQQCREGILSIVRYQVGKATEKPAADAAPAHTIDWAYDRWLLVRSRPPQTEKEAKDHLDAYVAHAKIALLSEVRRSHLVAWREALVKGGGLSSGSVNQRLTLVSAILRVGWREAEMPAPDLKMITLEDNDDSGRQAWSRDELLAAMRHLEPGSWAAWIFLIDLTTGVRLGEPMAAEVSWYDPAGFIHVRDRRKTKKRKLHCLPIIDCLREPLRKYVGNRKEGYLFADAPRPNNAKLKISHEASKWFGRFFRRHEIHRVTHELRHTWIEEARHSPIPKDIWEIISGHSRLTISDRYGGQKPDILAAANEKVCEFLTGDQELRAAMLRLSSGRSGGEGHYPRTSPPSIGITAPVT